MGGTGIDKHDQLLDRKSWTKMFKNCRCKRRFKKQGDGGIDVQCWILAFPYFGRCYWRKCPKIKPDWEETKEWLLSTIDAPALRVNGYLKNPFTDSDKDRPPHSRRQGEEEDNRQQGTTAGGR